MAALATASPPRALAGVTSVAMRMSFLQSRRTIALPRAPRAAYAALVALAVLAGCRSTPDPLLDPPQPSIRGGDLPPYVARVLVLNIHAGKDAAGQDNLDRVSALVRDHAADVVLLQEVDSLTTRSGRADQTDTLARRTGLHGRFGNALAYQGGGYGVATLSRWPVVDARLIRLPVDPPQERAGGSREPRGVLRLTLRTPGGVLHVLNTHLDPSADDRWRRQEADSVVAVARALAATGAPVLVGGDFNSTPESAVQSAIAAAGLRDLWPGCGAGDGFTFPARAPVRRIDYLYVAGRGVRCDSASVLVSDASDHLGVLFTLTVSGG